MTQIHDDTLLIADFSVDRTSPKFRMEDDVFRAHPVLPIPIIQDLLNVVRGLGTALDVDKAAEGQDERLNQILEKVAQIFDAMLETESAARMRERLSSRDGKIAVDLKRQVMPILHHLMERYGLRPTTASPDSSTGSPTGDAGTASVAGVSPEA